MLFECCASAPTPREPGAWFVWTIGDRKAEGSAVPFDEVMHAISSAHETLNKVESDPKVRYKSLQATSSDLRGLLETTFPGWTHRQQSTQTLKEAREAYAYALLCYTKAEMQACVVQQHLKSGQASTQALAQAAHNAAHLKMTFAALACCPEAAIEAYTHQAQACQLMSQHMEGQWSTQGSGIGHAIAWQQQHLAALRHAGSSTSHAEQEMDRLKQRNTTFEAVASVSPMQLSLR